LVRREKKEWGRVGEKREEGVGTGRKKKRTGRRE
jgi:hypothetical protein